MKLTTKDVKCLARFVKHGEREMFVKERILKTRKIIII